MTAESSAAIRWYRSPLPPGEMKKLHRRSNWRGALQTLGYLGTLALTGGAAFYASGHAPWWVTVPLVFLHGMVFAFLINGIHELGHNTVFRSSWLNQFFLYVLAFLDWHHVRKFQSSHQQHHRYTLHPPDDLEVVLPMRVVMKAFIKTRFVHPAGVVWRWKELWRAACGRFQGEWELSLFPEDQPELRRPVIRWARAMIVGHLLIVAAALWFKLWMIPVLVTLAPFYGGWLFFLCNTTQHIGLQDHVSDYRLCCRTFTIHPLIRFLYWNMNYHIEHHMYAAVPCYNLHRLHRLIRHDLPPCPNGLVQTWREIIEIQRRQDADPAYQHVPPLPQPTGAMEAA